MDKRRQRLERMYADCAKWFAKHELLHRHDHNVVSSYVIGTPGSSVYRVEVYVGRGTITVQGDIDLMSFQGGPSQHRSRIWWLANATGGYLTEKAGMGCTCSELVHEYDSGIARDDVIRDRRFGCMSKEQAQVAWDMLKQGCDPREVNEAVHEIEYTEGVDLGKVMSQRVIVAQVAVQCLARLLDEADSKQQATSGIAADDPNPGV